jgi:uncharacterized membrane protein
MARAEVNGQTGAVGRLKAEAGDLIGALTGHALSSVRGKVDSMTSRLTDFAEGEGSPSLIAAVTGAKNMAEGKGPVRSLLGAGLAGLKEQVSGALDSGKGGGRGGRKKLKITNIVESIDVGVPVRLAYDQWNEFREFSTFMKKVESADRGEEDNKLNWKAQVFWSHRTWESTVIDQRPDERIVWRSKGSKGHVDGTVTFHELAPNLTRILLVLEYHPQGMFEHTGNIWRAQGRRARLELKHFARHVMTNSVLNPDEIEGWRGVIEDGEVVLDHEEALEKEAREQGEAPRQDRVPRQARRAADAREDEAPDDASDEEGASNDSSASRRRRVSTATGVGSSRRHRHDPGQGTGD